MTKTIKANLNNQPSRMVLSGVNYQRNGISGEGFYVVSFRMDDRSMVAVKFNSDKSRCAILDHAEPASSDWRGDVFEPYIQQWIDEYIAEGSAWQ